MRDPDTHDTKVARGPDGRFISLQSVFRIDSDDEVTEHVDTHGPLADINGSPIDEEVPWTWISDDDNAHWTWTPPIQISAEANQEEIEYSLELLASFENGSDENTPTNDESDIPNPSFGSRPPGSMSSIWHGADARESYRISDKHAGRKVPRKSFTQNPRALPLLVDELDEETIEEEQERLERLAAEYAPAEEFFAQESSVA